MSDHALILLIQGMGSPPPLHKQVLHKQVLVNADPPSTFDQYPCLKHCSNLITPVPLLFLCNTICNECCYLWVKESRPGHSPPEPCFAVFWIIISTANHWKWVCAENYLIIQKYDRQTSGSSSGLTDFETLTLLFTEFSVTSISCLNNTYLLMFLVILSFYIF